MGRQYRLDVDGQESFIDLLLDHRHLRSLGTMELKVGVIRIVPSVAKTRRQRFVDISDNLLEWLMAYRGQGQIYFSRVFFTALRKAANVEWSSDVARHCFASYHLAHHENVQKTCLQMGHSLPDMLFNHYRGLVKRDDAAKFWSVRPHAEGKIVQFAKSAG